MRKQGATIQTLGRIIGVIIVLVGLLQTGGSMLGFVVSGVLVVGLSVILGTLVSAVAQILAAALDSAWAS